jgi:hypothetical protein
VVYGKYLGSNIGYKLDTYSLTNIYLTSLIKQILVGLLLGDGNIRKPTPNSNPQIQDNQGFVHLNHMLIMFFFYFLQ